MFKGNYLKCLLEIEKAVGDSGKFEFDMVLDGYYDFNMHEVTALFELLSIIDTLTADRKMQAALFRYRNHTYEVSREADINESVVVYGSDKTDAVDCITENELIEQINRKSAAKEKLYAVQKSLLLKDNQWKSR